MPTDAVGEFRMQDVVPVVVAELVGAAAPPWPGCFEVEATGTRLMPLMLVTRITNQIPTSKRPALDAKSLIK